MKQGYLGIFRKFFDHEFWKEKRQYSKAEAWIDLMQCARYGEKPENLLDKRGAYILEYGDVYISSRYLGKRWLWSRTKVAKFLEYLEKRESITYKKKDSHRTIINITNLKGYTDWIQGIREEKASDQTSEEPVESQSSASEKPKKKKVKKDKNEKKEPKTFMSDSEEIRLVDYFMSQIKINKSDFKEPCKQSWAKTFDLMIRRDERQPREIAELIKWCQNDSFEMVNVLSPDKLRKRFDQLVMKMKSNGGNRGENPGARKPAAGKYDHLDK